MKGPDKSSRKRQRLVLKAEQVFFTSEQRAQGRRRLQKSLKQRRTTIPNIDRNSSREGTSRIRRRSWEKALTPRASSWKATYQL